MYYFISLLQPIGGEKVSDIIILRPKRDPTKKIIPMAHLCFNSFGSSSCFVHTQYWTRTIKSRCLIFFFVIASCIINTYNIWNVSSTNWCHRKAKKTLNGWKWIGNILKRLKISTGLTFRVRGMVSFFLPPSNAPDSLKKNTLQMIIVCLNVLRQIVRWDTK